MTVDEIFAKINSHMIEGVMLHDQMAEYYDFLNFHGYKRCHEYHAMKEFAERRALIRYYINHYNRLLPEEDAKNPAFIPVGWRMYTRQQVDAAAKKRAIRDAFTRWKQWETDAKELYENSVAELMSMGEPAASCKVRECLCGVEKELKWLERERMELEDIDYDLSVIYALQPEKHEKYAKKARKIGVKIC